MPTTANRAERRRLAKLSRHAPTVVVNDPRVGRIETTAPRALEAVRLDALGLEDDALVVLLGDGPAARAQRLPRDEMQNLCEYVAERATGMR